MKLSESDWFQSVTNRPRDERAAAEAVGRENLARAVRAVKPSFWARAWSVACVILGGAFFALVAIGCVYAAIILGGGR